CETASRARDVVILAVCLRTLIATARCLEVRCFAKIAMVGGFGGAARLTLSLPHLGEIICEAYILSRSQAEGAGRCVCRAFFSRAKPDAELSAPQGQNSGHVHNEAH